MMAPTTPYEALIIAASSLTGTEILQGSDEADLAVAELFVENNSEALASARDALRAGCTVSLKNEASFFAERCNAVPPLRNLANAFVLELRLAANRCDFANAVQIGVDLFDLANATRRGGLKIDFLVSLALSDLGFSRLRRLRDRLDEPSRRSLVSALDRINREQEPFAVIAKRDRDWENAVNYPDAPFDVAQDRTKANLVGRSEEEHTEMFDCIQAFAKLPVEEQNSIHASLDRRCTASMRMLKIDLALRSYRHAASTYPEDLTDLIPDFLDNLPLDPLTDQPFVYRNASGDSFVLYSTGPHKIDHGGVFGHWLDVEAGRVDFCLDTNDYSLDCCTLKIKPRGIIPRILATIRSTWTSRRVGRG